MNRAGREAIGSQSVADPGVVNGGGCSPSVDAAVPTFGLRPCPLAGYQRQSRGQTQQLEWSNMFHKVLHVKWVGRANHGLVTVLLSSETAAIRVNALPLRVAPVLSVIDWSAISVP